MTKLEFSIKLEKYQIKQKVTKRVFLILGIVFFGCSHADNIVLY